MKALTYGNLGTGGLSKATFEQSFTDAHPSGGFEPGYGTHTVEHRAIDAAGNIGDADHFRATVLPGGSPECTTAVAGGRGARGRPPRPGGAPPRAAWSCGAASRASPAGR